jgi:tRNA-dihydrouridine synthase B
VRDVFFEHLEHITNYQVERKAILDLRRVGCWFLRNGKGARHLRESLNRCQSMAEVHALLSAFPWHETDFTPTKEKEETPVECVTCAD